MQKRPTSTPEMETDHSIRGHVHKRTPSNLRYNHGYNSVAHKLKQFMNVPTPFQQSRDICLLPLRVCPLLIILHNCDESVFFNVK